MEDTDGYMLVGAWAKVDCPHCGTGIMVKAWGHGHEPRSFTCCECDHPVLLWDQGSMYVIGERLMGP